MRKDSGVSSQESGVSNCGWMARLRLSHFSFQPARIAAQSAAGGLSSLSPSSSAFTLIEILVALAILSVMVIGIAQVFDESTVAWDSGMRRSEAMMTGRAITELAATEAGLAFIDPTPSRNSFYIREGVNDEVEIAYPPPGGGVRRSENGSSDWLVQYTAASDVRVAGFDMQFDGAAIPRYVDILVETVTDDKGRTDQRLFDTRAFLINRDRYRYDVE